MSAQPPGRRLNWESLIRGSPGHPLHPPLTDATIGMFTLSAGLAIIGSVGGIEAAAAKAMWLALIGGLIVAVPTAVTGFVDWVTIRWGTPRWRTATLHLSAMLLALTLFALAAWQQQSGYRHGQVTLGGLVLTLAGFAVLLIGGWLGGSVVFVHGMRVLGKGESRDHGDAPHSQDPGTGHPGQYEKRSERGGCSTTDYPRRTP